MSFKTIEEENLFNEVYQKNLELWEISHQSIYVETSYGKTHIITAGEKHLPPLILLHGAGMGATIWYKNIDTFCENHRVFAIDVMGDMNKSDPIKSFHSGEDIAGHFVE